MDNFGFSVIIKEAHVMIRSVEDMKKNKNPYRNLVLISQIGIQIMVPIFMCLLIGILSDEKFSTFFTLPLLTLGILAGGRNAYLLAMSTIKEEKNEEDTKH